MQDFSEIYANNQTIVMGGDIPDFKAPIDDTSQPGEEVAGTVFQEAFFISLLKEFQTLFHSANLQLLSPQNDETDLILRSITTLISTKIDPFIGNTVPVGGIISYVGNTIPTEFTGAWGFCDGSAFDTQTYIELNSVLAASGGYEDGKLPDLQCRMPIGAGQNVVGRRSFPIGQSSDLTTNKMRPETMFPHTHNFQEIASDGTVSETGTYLKDASVNSNAADIKVANNDVTNNAGDAVEHQIGLDVFGGDGNGDALPFDIVGPYLAVNYIIRMK